MGDPKKQLTQDLQSIRNQGGFIQKYEFRYLFIIITLTTYHGMLVRPFENHN